MLTNSGYFVKFFKRRNMYKFLIKKKYREKNEVTRNLSACVIEKFNGYEIIRNDLARKERLDFQPLDIVYEPCLDETTPVICNVTPKMFTAYKG